MPFNTFGNIFFWTSAKLTKAYWTCINVEFTLRPILFVLKPVSQRGSLREGASQISGCKLWENHQFLRLELDQLLRKTECIITRGRGKQKYTNGPMHMCAQSPPDSNSVTKTIQWHCRQSVKCGLSDCWAKIDGKSVHLQFGWMVTDGNSIITFARHRPACRTISAAILLPSHDKLWEPHGLISILPACLGRLSWI